MNQFLFRTFLTALILLSIPITTKAYDFESEWPNGNNKYI